MLSPRNVGAYLSTLKSWENYDSIFFQEWTVVVPIPWLSINILREIDRVWELMKICVP